MTKAAIKGEFFTVQLRVDPTCEIVRAPRARMTCYTYPC